MITYDVLQQTGDWWALRLGIPTASRMDSIVRSEPTWLAARASDGEVLSRHTMERTATDAAAKHQKKLGVDVGVHMVFQPSAGAETYMDALLAEWLLGYSPDEACTRQMERGIELEPEALAFWELQRDAKATPGGFITNDDGTVGVSPDARVYDEHDELVGGVELKCPEPKTQIGYFRRPEELVADYRHQVQAALMVTGARWWDLMSYHPMLPPVIVRVQPDDNPAYRDALLGELTMFVVRLQNERAAFEERGYHGRVPTLDTERVSA